MDRDVVLDVLSIRELINAIGPEVYLPGACRRNRGVLLGKLRSLSSSVQN